MDICKLTKIVESVRADFPYVVVTYHGEIYGCVEKPRAQCHNISGVPVTWTVNPRTTVLLAILPVKVENWNELIWVFKQEPKVAAPIEVNMWGVEVSSDYVAEPLWKNFQFKALKDKLKKPNMVKYILTSNGWSPDPSSSWDIGEQYKVIEQRIVRMTRDMHFVTGLQKGDVEVGDTVYLSSIGGEQHFIKFPYKDTEGHREMLKRGVLHLTERNAVLMTKCLLTITGAKPL